LPTRAFPVNNKQEIFTLHFNQIVKFIREMVKLSCPLIERFADKLK